MYPEMPVHLFPLSLQDLLKSLLFSQLFLQADGENIRYVSCGDNIEVPTPLLPLMYSQESFGNLRPQSGSLSH